MELALEDVVAIAYEPGQAARAGVIVGAVAGAAIGLLVVALIAGGTPSPDG